MRHTYNVDDAYNAYMEQYNKVSAEYRKRGLTPLPNLKQPQFERALEKKINDIKARGGRPSSKVKLAKTIANTYGYYTPKAKAQELKKLAMEHKTSNLLDFVSKVWQDTSGFKGGDVVVELGYSTTNLEENHPTPNVTRFAKDLLYSKDEQWDKAYDRYDKFNSITYKEIERQFMNGELPKDFKVAFDILYYPNGFDHSKDVPVYQYNEFDPRIIISGQDAAIQDRIFLDSELFAKMYDIYNSLGSMSVKELMMNPYKKDIGMLGLDKLTDLYQTLKSEGMSASQAALFVGTYIYGSK